MAMEALGAEVVIKNWKNMISKRKFIFRIILVSTLVFVVFSCLLPSNKTQYIRKYERFVDQVKTRSREYQKKTGAGLINGIKNSVKTGTICMKTN